MINRKRSSIDSDTLYVKALNERGDVFSMIGNNHAALQDVSRAISTSRELRLGELLTDCMLNLSRIYNTVSEFHKMKMICEKTLTLYGKGRDKNGAAKSLNMIGLSYASIGKYGRAINYYRRSCRVCRAINDYSGLGTALSNLGMAHWYLGNYSRALGYMKRSLGMREAMGQARGIGACFVNIGALYDRIGNYQKAVDYFKRSLAIATKIGDRRGQAACLNNIGLMYYRLSDCRQALDHFNRSLDICNEMGDVKNRAVNWINIGITYQAMGHWDKAFKNFSNSLEMHQKVGDQFNSAEGYKNLGSLYHQLGDYATALDYYKLSLNLRRLIGDKNGIAGSLSLLGKVYLEMGSLGKARHYFSNAKKIVHALKEKEINRRIALGLGEIELMKARTPDDPALRSAEVYYEKACRLARELHSRTGQAEAMLLYARILGKKGSLYSSSNAFKQTLRLYRCLKQLFGYAITCYYYARFKQMRGDQRGAMKYSAAARKIFSGLKAKGWLKRLDSSRRQIKE